MRNLQLLTGINQEIENFLNFKGQRRLQPYLPFIASHSYGLETDLLEHEDYYEYKINVPGFSREDISLEVKDGVLIVGAHKLSSGASTAQEDNSNATASPALAKPASRVLYNERKELNLIRHYRLAEDMNLEQVKAQLNDGVLSISISKVVPQPPASTKINIE